MIKRIEICASCAKGSTTDPGFSLKDFVEAVQRELSERKPEVQWQVQTTSCQRFCPPQKITLIVSNKLTMSRDATVESVVEEILRREG
nr:hypothetical protein [uncultured Bdellovibrio sp.]